MPKNVAVALSLADIMLMVTAPGNAVVEQDVIDPELLAQHEGATPAVLSQVIVAREDLGAIFAAARIAAVQAHLEYADEVDFTLNVDFDEDSGSLFVYLSAVDDEGGQDDIELAEIPDVLFVFPEMAEDASDDEEGLLLEFLMESVQAEISGLVEFIESFGRELFIGDALVTYEDDVDGLVFAIETPFERAEAFIDSLEDEGYDEDFINELREQLDEAIADEALMDEIAQLLEDGVEFVVEEDDAQ